MSTVSIEVLRASGPVLHMGFRHRLRDSGIGSGPPRRSRPKHATHPQGDLILGVVRIFRDLWRIYQGFLGNVQGFFEDTQEQGAGTGSGLQR